MKTASGFSCQYVSLAVALRLALDDYIKCVESPRTERAGSIEEIETPRARAINVVLLNAALCESVINTCLALGFSAEAWALLGRSSTMAKWTIVSQLLWPSYSLPASHPLCQELKVLFECRNAIVHASPEVYEGPHKRHKGNVAGWRKLDDKLVRGSFDLVLRLLQHLGRFEHKAMLHYASIREHLINP